jgi:hypothetical protein
VTLKFLTSLGLVLLIWSLAFFFIAAAVTKLRR